MMEASRRLTSSSHPSSKKRNQHLPLTRNQLLTSQSCDQPSRSVLVSSGARIPNMYVQPIQCSSALQYGNNSSSEITVKLNEMADESPCISVYIPANRQRYHDTANDGYCGVHAIHQAYIHYIINNDCLQEEARLLTDELTAMNFPIWKSGMQDFLQECLSLGLPNVSLRLDSLDNLAQHVLHQFLYILVAWSTHSNILSQAILRIIDYRQSYDSNNTPKTLPYEYWIATDEIGCLRLRFPLTFFQADLEDSSKQILMSTNIVNLEQSAICGPMFQLSILDLLPLGSIIRYATSHYYWDEFPFSRCQVRRICDNLRTESSAIPDLLTQPSMSEIIAQRRRVDYFFQSQVNQAWLLDYLCRIPADSPIYPDQEVRIGFSDTLDWFEVVSTANYGLAVIFKRNLPVNAFAFVYAGIPTSTYGEYTMKMKQFNVDPEVKDPFSFSSRCNEYIWSLEKNNVKHISQGLTVTTREASQNEFVWLSYGEDYSWRPLLSSYMEDMEPVIRALASIQATNPPPLDQLLPILRNSGSKLQQLLRLFYHPLSDIDQPVEPLFSLMHTYNPPPGLSPTAWIEFMLRSKWTYANFCFRRRDDPLGLYYPDYLVQTFAVPKRACVKLPVCTYYPNNPQRNEFVNYYPQRYKKARAKTSTDDFFLTQLHHVNLFDFQYQDDETSPLLTNPLLVPSNCPTLTPSPMPATSTPPVIHETDVASTNVWPYELTNDNLRSMFFNIDGANISAFIDILQAMVQHKVDVVCIVDPRLDEKISTILREIRQLPQRIRLFYSPQPAAINKEDRVGGVLFLTSERIDKPKYERICPEGSLAVLHGSFGGVQTHFFGTYWPQFNRRPLSLWTRMLTRYKQNPIIAVKAKLSSALLEYHQSNHTNFVFGDFNSDLTLAGKDKYDLEAFRVANWLLHSSSAKQLQSHSYGLPTITGRGQSRIDYQFSNGFNLQQEKTLCFPSDIFHHIGSHRALLGSYYFTTTVPRKLKSKPAPYFCTIDVKNAPKVEQLKAQYVQLHDDLQQLSDPETIVCEATIKSVLLAKQLFKAKKKRLAHFSPQAAALLVNLNFLRRIAIGVLGSKQAPPWKQRQFNRNMKSINKQWMKELRKISDKAGDDASLHELISKHADCFGYQYWSDKTLEDVRLSISSAYTETKKRLHVRRQADMRRDFVTRLHKLESLREAGKLKQVIGYVLGLKQQPYNFDELLVGDQPISNQESIHHHITQHFRTWFKALPVGPQASNLPHDFKDFTGSWENFRDRFSSTQIDEHLLRLLFSSLASGPDQVHKQRMHDTLMEPPSLSEFLDTIKHTKNGTAPGPSGLTYSMIKLWSNDMQTYIFQQLLVLWESHKSPQHWTDKWLAPIPKTANPSLETLRPISLLECLRKLWVAIIINRIQTLFAAGGYLHPSQHGCLRGVGTDEAILEVINLLESAKLSQRNVFLASWDIKRAFDRVPKSLLVFAWLRMGVPLPIALYLVELDIGGRTMVKTPFAIAEVMSSISDTNRLAFLAETGCAQGDPQSAISWNCFIDILLVALHDPRVTQQPAYFCNHHGVCTTYKQTAFVDDILSALFTEDDLQRQADVVSAFTILAGMEISVTKLKAFYIGWGNPNVQVKGSFLLHSKGWSPHVIPLVKSGTFKYLGLLIDTQLSFIPQYKILLQQTILLCAKIRSSPLSAETKIRILLTSLMPKLIYVAKCVPWTMAQLYEFDSIIAQTYRVIAKLLPSTAVKLLHMSHDVGGLALPRFSSLTNARKLKLLMRLDQQSTYRRQVVSGLLGRGAEVQAHTLPVGVGTTLSASITPCWTSSLIQELHLSDMKLHVHGSAPHPADLFYTTTKFAKSLSTITNRRKTGVILVAEDSNESQLLRLRVGQVWASSTIHNPHEILGFSEDYTHILCHVWRPTLLAPGALIRKPTHDSVGLTAIKYEDLFPNHEGVLIRLDDAIYEDQFLRKTIKHLQCHRIIPPRHESTSPVVFQLLSELGNQVAHIYTDGGWKRSPKLHEPLAYEVKAGAVILLRYISGNYAAIQLTVDIPTKSVFPLELTAVVAAQILASGSSNSPTIYSDSTSAISVMTGVHKNKLFKQLLQYYCTTPNLFANAPMVHVKSHIERRKKDADTWSEHELGNYIADAITLMDSSQQHIRVQLPGNHSEITVPCIAVIPVTTILKALASYKAFFVSDTFGVLEIRSQILRRQDLEATQYLHQRDAYRLQRGDKAKWFRRELASIKFTREPAKSLRDKANTLKVVYDKHWTRGNVMKYLYSNNTEFDDRCQLCGSGSETQAHIIHGCSHKEMENFRDKARGDIRKWVEALRSKHKKAGVILEALCDIAMDNRKTYIWTGLWPKSAIRRFARALSHPRRGICIQTVLRWTRFFTNITSELYRIRSLLLHKPNKPSNQLRLTACTVPRCTTVIPTMAPVRSSSRIRMKTIHHYGFLPDHRHMTTASLLTSRKRNLDLPFTFATTTDQRHPQVSEPQTAESVGGTSYFPLTFHEYIHNKRHLEAPFKFSEPKHASNLDHNPKHTKARKRTRTIPDGEPSSSAHDTRMCQHPPTHRG